LLDSFGENEAAAYRYKALEYRLKWLLKALLEKVTDAEVKLTINEYRQYAHIIASFNKASYSLTLIGSRFLIEHDLFKALKVFKYAKGDNYFTINVYFLLKGEDDKAGDIINDTANSSSSTLAN